MSTRRKKDAGEAGVLLTINQLLNRTIIGTPPFPVTWTMLGDYWDYEIFISHPLVSDEVKELLKAIDTWAEATAGSYAHSKVRADVSQVLWAVHALVRQRQSQMQYKHGDGRNMSDQDLIDYAKKYIIEVQKALNIEPPREH